MPVDCRYLIMRCKANIIRFKRAKAMGKTFAVDIDGTITENGQGRIHLEALSALRHLADTGHNVIFVTGRSSVEGFLLSVFGGTTRASVGENGGCITLETNKHILLGDMQACRKALEVLQNEIKGVVEKPVFPRMTEVVLERTFDLNLAETVLQEKSLNVALSDSQYAYHINSHGIDKGTGFRHMMGMLGISGRDVIAIGDSSTDIPLFKIAGTSIALGNASEHVRSAATISVRSHAGDGVIEALDAVSSTLSEA